MKHWFVFFTKFVIGSFLLITSVDSAVSSHFFEDKHAKSFARSYWKDIHKWDGSFILKDGSVVRHTEHGITLERDGVIEQQLVQQLYINQRNGNDLYYPLDLKTHLTRADFVCKLCQSELYQKTEEDEEDLAENGNWEAEITVTNLYINGIKCRTICHKPGEISFRSTEENLINLSEAYTNEYGHKQYSSPLYRINALHLERIEDGRKVCLSTKLSCSEFTRTLFDCGHVMFGSYPPHTIQGLPNRKYVYYYYGDLEKPEWQKVQAAARAAEAEKEKEENKKRKAKEAIKRMWKKKHNEHKRMLKKQQEEQKKTSQSQQEEQPETPTNKIKQKEIANKHKLTFNPFKSSGLCK